MQKFRVLNPYKVPEGNSVFSNERVGSFFEGDEFEWPNPDTNTDKFSAIFIEAAIRDGVIEEVT